MSTVLAPFPDGEDVLMALLEQVAPTVQSTPSNFTPPLIQVRQTGGGNDRITNRPVLEVACFGTDYAAAKTMAAECEQIILAARFTSVPGVPGHPDGVYLDKTETATSPREVAYEDQTRRRKTAAYRLAYRRPR